MVRLNQVKEGKILVGEVRCRMIKAKHVDKPTKIKHLRTLLSGKFSTETLEFISRTRNFWNGFAPSYAHQLRCNFKRILLTQATKLCINQK
jgi:hypothetical protein